MSAEMSVMQGIVCVSGKGSLGCKRCLNGIESQYALLRLSPRVLFGIIVTRRAFL